MKKGQKHTLETKKKMRRSHKGRVVTEIWRRRISIANKGGNKTSFRKGMTPWNKGIKLPDNFGENHPLWKGEKCSYTALHNWIRLKLGELGKCEKCGTTKAKKYEWANKDHLYKRNKNDWIRLCTKCHRRYDYENNR